MTFLFDKIVFGPLKSRRLGLSLGINLLPTGRKLCNMDCIYCECGWTSKKVPGKNKLPSREMLVIELGKKIAGLLNTREKINSITFAGNGEPTLHPQFEDIMNDTIELRDLFMPGCRICVLSNAQTIGKKSVVRALLKADLPVLKLDAGTEKTFRAINRTKGKNSLEKTTSGLRELKGKIAIQTLFLRCRYKNQVIDNTTDAEVGAWIGKLKEISPKEVFICGIDRDTPLKGIEKISKRELESIASKARKAGFTVWVH